MIKFHTAFEVAQLRFKVGYILIIEMISNPFSHIIFFLVSNIYYNKLLHCNYIKKGIYCASCLNDSIVFPKPFSGSPKDLVSVSTSN